MTFCLPSRWREGAPSWHDCCTFSRNCSVSFLISQHSDALWHVKLCTGHFALPSSLLDNWRGRLSPLGPPPVAAAAAVGAPASGWLPPAFLLLLLSLPLPPPWACVPALGLLSPLRRLGDWGVPGAALCSLGALVHQVEERRDILDVMGGEFL
jgi:hypothetical protein